MVVSGGGGEEEVSDINFFLPSKIEISVLTIAQDWSFSWNFKGRECQLILYIKKAFRQKTF